MLLQIVLCTALIIVATAQENSKQQNDAQKQKDNSNSQVLYLDTEQPEFQKQNEIQPLMNLKQFQNGQPFSPELYGLTYLEPQYQAEGILPRLHPQIVLYGPRRQGQPILINPGNPPGNFLIPQGPGPNVIVTNNPQIPQFPVAGYPKPAHIPPIEKDAEEIPTNPANIPPLPSNAKPVTKPKNKPEKLETFNEPNQPDQNVNINQGHFPQESPETVSLQPGQRFFILNGNNIYSYPFEAQPQVQQDFPAFRYTNVQPFPQNPPKFLQTFNQEPLQILQRGQEDPVSVSVPNLLQRNTFINSQQLQSQAQQPESQPQQTESQSQQPNQENDVAFRTDPQYFRTAFPINQPEFPLYPQHYPVNQQGAITTDTLDQNIQGIPNVRGVSSKGELVQPQLVGQFRFTPNAVPGSFPFKEDFENDAIVVDASFDASSNFNGRGENLKAEESESTTSSQQQPAQKEREPSVAQAEPQATAIAGPSGVAGSAPRGTAIVGKGGLAVSSPQATAVAGTKDEDKKKRPLKKEA